MSESTYKIDKDLGVTFLFFRGFLDFNNFSGLEKRVITDPDYNPQYSVIADLSEAEGKLDIEAINRAIEFMKKYIHKLSQRKIAILADEPDHYLAAYYYKELSHELPFEIEIFTTVEAAQRWLQLIVFR